MNEKKIVPNCPYCGSENTIYKKWDATGWFDDTNQIARYCTAWCCDCGTSFQYNEVYKFNFDFSEIYSILNEVK